jgi:O-antigen/teichoic acid export membrane protein
MSQNKIIVVNSLLLYVRLIITTIVGIISARIVIRNLGAEDYGLYSVVGGVVVMMAFINTVMVSTTYRFIAFEMGRKCEEAINKVFNISLHIHIGMAVLVVLFAETFGKWYINTHLNVESHQIDNALFVFRFSVLATVFNIISIPYQGLITALEKFKVRVSIEIIRSVLLLFFVMSLIYYSGDKLRLYAVLMAVLALLPSSLYIFYCIRKYALYTQWKIQGDRKKYKEMLAFSGWTSLGAAAWVGQRQGSALIINLFFGTILNAAYGIANQLNSFITLFASNLGQAAIPQITKSHSGGDDKRMTEVVTYISKYSFFLMLLPALPILIETEYLLKLWLGEIPEYTVIFTQLLIILGLISSLRSGVPAAIQATGEIKWFQIINSTILLLGLPIAYLLFKYGYQPFSIQIVYIIITVINTLISLFLLKKIDFDVKYLINKSFIKIAYVIICIMPIFYIHSYYEASLSRFLIFSTISVLWSLTAIYICGLEKRERNAIITGMILVKNKIVKH